MDIYLHPACLSDANTLTRTKSEVLKSALQNWLAVGDAFHF